MGQSLFVIGASGHALVVIEAAEAQGWRIAGLLDSFKPLGTELLRHRVVGRPADLPQLLKQNPEASAILAISDNTIRRTMSADLEALVPTLAFATVVHPAAWVSPSATLGKGTLVLAGAVVNALCQVGEHCIINTKASLDHEGVMEPFSCLLPGVTTGGDVRIGEGSFVCAGATVSHRVQIGHDVLIAAGATVLSDIPPECLAAGIPAVVKRKRKPGERHF